MYDKDLIDTIITIDITRYNRLLEIVYFVLFIIIDWLVVHLIFPIAKSKYSTCLTINCKVINLNWTKKQKKRETKLR